MHSLAAVRSGIPNIARTTFWLALCLDAILKHVLHAGNDAPRPLVEAHANLAAYRQPLLDGLTRIHGSLMLRLPTLLHSHTEAVLRFVVCGDRGCPLPRLAC